MNMEHKGTQRTRMLPPMPDYNKLTDKLLKTIDKDLVRGYRDNEGKKIYPEVKDVAKWYNVSYGTLRKKVGKLNWQDRRTDYINKVNTKVQEKKERNDEEISDAEAEAIVVQDYHFNESANKLRRATDKEIDKIINGEVYLYTDKDGNPVYGTPKNAPYQLMNAGKALESAQKISKTAAGEPSEISRIQSNQNVKLDITNPEFMDSELEFAKKLIKK